MAIFSCNLRSIGRTTHDPGTAGAHIRYISRQEARPVILAEHMPADPVAARTWMDKRERGMRSNARVIDKLRLALPRELSQGQRAALVRAFMANLAAGQIPWFAAIHQRGKDAHNPHVHIALHDRNIDGGKRLLRLSDNAHDRLKAGLPGPKAVEWVRERWETVCNAALAGAGLEDRIDRRSLKAQGLDRKPGIHEGPRAQHIEGNVRRPRSRRRTNGCGRVIDYPSIDHGRTRREFNAQIIDLNLERAIRSRDPVKATWAKFEKEQITLDRKAVEQIAVEERKHTAAARKAALIHAQRMAQLRDGRDRAWGAAVVEVRARFVPQREAMRKAQAAERAALKDKHSRLRARLLRLLDVTGTARRRQEAARKLLSAEHRTARKALTARYKTVRTAAWQTVRRGFQAQAETLKRGRRSELAKLERSRAEIGRLADTVLQQREIEREHMRGITERKAETWRKQRKDDGPLGVESGFARAMKRAAQQEGRRGRGKSGDFERER